MDRLFKLKSYVFGEMRGKYREDPQSGIDEVRRLREMMQAHRLLSEPTAETLDMEFIDLLSLFKQRFPQVEMKEIEFVEDDDYDLFDLESETWSQYGSHTMADEITSWLKSGAQSPLALGSDEFTSESVRRFINRVIDREHERVDEQNRNADTDEFDLAGEILEELGAVQIEFSAAMERGEADLEFFLDEFRKQI